MSYKIKELKKPQNLHFSKLSNYHVYFLYYKLVSHIKINNKEQIEPEQIDTYKYHQKTLGRLFNVTSRI